MVGRKKSLVSFLTVLLMVKVFVLHAQTPEKSIVPFVKENHEVDSIIRIAVNASHSKNICFSLTTIHSPIGYYFSILRLAKGVNNTYYRVIQPEDIKIFGYFVMDGYKIFVYGDDEPLVFFEKTKQKSEFNFIELKDIVSWDSPNDLYEDDPERRHGKFVVGTSTIHDKILPKHKK